MARPPSKPTQSRVGFNGLLGGVTFLLDIEKVPHEGNKVLRFKWVCGSHEHLLAGFEDWIKGSSARVSRTRTEFLELWTGNKGALADRTGVHDQPEHCVQFERDFTPRATELAGAVEALRRCWKGKAARRSMVGH